MFHTEKVDKRLGWWKGYDTKYAPPQETGEAYEVKANLSSIQFTTVEEAEEAVKKLSHFWNTEFVFKDGK